MLYHAQILRLFAYVVSLLGLCCCTACTNSETHWMNSETHWLSECLTDSDCIAPYECLCRICTRPCYSNASCHGVFSTAEATCNAFSDSVSSWLCEEQMSDRPNACVPTCSEDSDCATLPEGVELMCMDGGRNDCSELPDAVWTCDDTGCEPNPRENKSSCVGGVCIYESEVRELDPIVESEREPNNTFENAQTISNIGPASVGWLWPHREIPIDRGIIARLEPEDNPVDGFDRDFYSFEADEGAWLAIVVLANPGDKLGEINTVITLYDSSENEIALSNDTIDTFRGTPFGEPDLFTEVHGNETHFDSELIFRIPSDGTYYLAVEDFAYWGDTRFHNLPGDYQLLIGRFEPGMDGVMIDPEVGDEGSDAASIEDRSELSLVLGTLRDVADVDVFARSVDRAAILHAQIVSYGPDGFATAPVDLRVTPSADDDGTIARLLDETHAVAPPVPGGEYRIWVASSSDTVEHGAYYVLKHQLIDETEADSDHNDTPADATRISLYDNSAWFWLTLEDGDVDYITFDLPESRTFERVDCWSRVEGSGVLGLNVSLLDAEGELIDAENEQPPGPAGFIDEGPSIEVGVPTYLRLSKTGQSSGIAGEWVHCYFALH